MTFINWSILFGLGAVSIPILIHLFNRRKARVIDWGAMQFLQGSLVNRKRRILIEELILMALRCLLVAVLVLAIARPFSPVGSRISWFVLLPLLLIAALLMAVATIVSRKPGWRWLWIACGVAVGIGAVMLSRNEQILQAGFWKKSTDQDIAIVIDGSSSMSIEVDGETSFSRAISEANMLVDSLGPEDNVSIIVSGGAIERATPEPISVRSNPKLIMEQLAPLGGRFSFVDSLAEATDVLTESDNATKKIVVFTDGQANGWDTDDENRWKLAGEQLESLPVKPKVITRLVGLPKTFENVSVSSCELSRDIIGVDRPIMIRANVENTGFEPARPIALQLFVDGEQKQSEEVAEIPAGESLQFNLRHRFESTGSHTVEVRLLIEDDLKDDNSQTRIAQVLDQVPVLLVDGAASSNAAERATMFAEVALAPPAEIDDEQDFEDGPNASSKPASDSLIKTSVISVTEFGGDTSLDEYRVVVLCDVPRLNTDAAKSLAQFVSEGGGLLIAPGARCESEFFNEWKTENEETILPMALAEKILVDIDEPSLQVAIESLEHPAFANLVADSGTDFSQMLVESYWKIASDEQSTISAGAKLANGDPLLVEKKLGEGTVAVITVSLDSEGNNFPVLQSFLPFMHELTFSLASPSLLELNHEPASLVSIELPLDVDKESDSQKSIEKSGETVSEPVTVTTPSGDALAAVFQRELTTQRIDVPAAGRGGVYRAELSDDLSQRLLATDQLKNAITKSPDGASLQFAVSYPADESRLDPLSRSDKRHPEQFVDYFLADDSEQAIAAVIGDVPGHELWKYLAIGAVIILLAESFATRWIALQRKTGAAESVAFVTDGERMSTFQSRAKELLEATRSQ